ncbi:hypothetical protein T265_09917 [Opisthorchis viverrini]|uniref:Uncharacterized protein n=1 Tax=Opisthorchis viverrini TaxID=6198 RepID=A0A074Z8F6_OPIVI|nr:hypothetical protein T265_09917 [Opisthorchis viverrini]KER21852.1 hypothetical protein T265_09917 [Opisthorchis viverrini]
MPNSEWQKKRGGKSLTWKRGVKEITKLLGAVGATRFPGWGSRDPRCAWLETLPTDVSGMSLAIEALFGEKLLLSGRATLHRSPVFLSAHYGISKGTVALHSPLLRQRKIITTVSIA